MVMCYYFPRVPVWIASLDNLTYLDINLNPVEEEALGILGNLPALLCLWLTSKSAAPKQRLVVSSNMFMCLKECYFTCWSIGSGLMFQEGCMPKLEKLHLPFHAGTALDFGIQHLSSLRQLVVEIICSGATIQQVESLEEAIRKTADLLPCRPKVEIRTWDEENMKEQKEKDMVEDDIQTSC
ncbi:hypothetical protein E2562_002300 [Oryza meyeriana var. granulata]|uniref:Disease resistance R13L4/SHOC-2-like LRR domain-containing protein n=1 Tax=Oryza meyeriana var. granulata TaxID=110450 RepID=A0A6G1BIG8_9ORYZ|nr:hypothetical protein E2562_002300 [Oryza meyeriana var. granulata]